MQATISIEEYNAAVERIKGEQEGRFITTLTSLRDACRERGWNVSEPYDSCNEEFEWCLFIGFDEEGDGENNIIVMYTLSESQSNDGSLDGVNWHMNISSSEGRIIGFFSPYNYTNDVWVDVNDAEAVEARFELMENLDIRATVKKIEDFAIREGWIEQPAADDFSLVDNMELGYFLHDWHGGGGSYVYAIASALTAGHTPTDQTYIWGAMRELRRLKADASFPEAVSDEDEAECNRLADEIERRFYVESEDEGEDAE